LTQLPAQSHKAATAPFNEHTLSLYELISNWRISEYTEWIRLGHSTLYSDAEWPQSILSPSPLIAVSTRDH
jgi:hypothetical protein